MYTLPLHIVIGVVMFLWGTAALLSAIFRGEWWWKLTWNLTLANFWSFFKPIDEYETSRVRWAYTAHGIIVLAVSIAMVYFGSSTTFLVIVLVAAWLLTILVFWQILHGAMSHN